MHIYQTLLKFLLALEWNTHQDSNMKTLVVNTWNFEKAASAAYDAVTRGESAVKSLVRGCTACEELQCDGTVGFGGSPDETGETTLDALIIDGDSHNMGAVGCLRNIKNAIGVAHKVMENTEHTILVGEKATQFAIDMGFKKESLSTPHSIHLWKTWKDNSCQPNFWMGVHPDPKLSCGPYSSQLSNEIDVDTSSQKYSHENHDTIGMIVIDKNGKIAAGTSSNGANHKIPGRVGDAAIPGAGAYALKSVGAAVATGDGDVMMRFSPSYRVVDEMRRGTSPSEAAQMIIKEIATIYPKFFGAVIGVSATGEIGAACHGMATFPYCVGVNGEVQQKSVDCIHT